MRIGDAVWAVIRARHGCPLGGALLCLGVIAASWGPQHVALPGMNDTHPVAALLAAPYASVIMLALRSAVGEFERLSAHPLNIDLAILAAASACATVTLTIGLLAAGAPELIQQSVRNLLFWVALSCLAAFLAGRSLGWLCPLIVLIPLYALGSPPANEQEPWWVPPRQPPNSTVSWAITAALLCLGIVLLREITRWRKSMPYTRTRDASGLS